MWTTVRNDLRDLPGDRELNCMQYMSRYFVRGHRLNTGAGPDSCEVDVPANRVCRCEGRHILRLDRVPLEFANESLSSYTLNSPDVRTDAGCFVAQEGYINEGFLMASMGDQFHQRLFTYIIFRPPEEADGP